MRPDCTRGFGPVGTNGPAPIHDLPALLRDRAKGSGGDKLLEEAAAALEAAREDAERWRAVREMDGGAIYAVLGDCDGMHPELADAAIDQARGKGVADEAADREP